MLPTLFNINDGCSAYAEFDGEFLLAETLCLSDPANPLAYNIVQTFSFCLCHGANLSKLSNIANCLGYFTSIFVFKISKPLPLSTENCPSPPG